MKLLWQLAGTLLIVGIVMHWLWWILAAAATWLLIKAAKRWHTHAQAELAAQKRAQAALIRRADQQHAWAMQGDERGIYGDPSSKPASFM